MSDLGHRLIRNRAHSGAEGGEMCPDGSPTTLASGLGRRFMAESLHVPAQGTDSLSSPRHTVAKRRDDGG